MPPPRQRRRWAAAAAAAAAMLLVGLGGCGAAAGPTRPRAVLDFRDGWRFSRTDMGADSLDAGCSEAGLPCAPGFNDAGWRALSIPHDFVVEAPLVPSEDSVAKNQGYRDYGKAWYRLTFSLPEAWAHRSVWIDFDGVAGNATTFLNGERLGRHFSGYTSFRFHLEPGLLRWGDDGGANVLAVHVDASTPDGWWYDGGGLARSVRLVAANPLHIAPWGVYLPSAVAEGSTRAAHLGHEEGEDEEARKYDLAADAVMNAQVTVTNDGAAPATFTVQVVVTGPALGVGRAEATARSPAPVTLAAGATETFALPVALPGVALWSPRRPHLLQAAVQLLDATTAAGALLDEVKEMTGVRTLRFDAAQGFFLNGVPTKIQGMCNHQDFAGTGIAVPPSLQAYRVWRMVEMGANAWRTAHNPPAPELLDETDRQGMMVWNENHRNIDAGGQWLEDLRSMVLRDRNHPSVVIWSICNEILCMGFNATAARTLVAEIKRLDPEGGRVVSAAQNMEFDVKRDFGESLDLFGVNYNIVQYDLWHAQYPQQPMIASETSSALSDRGVYAKDEASGYISSYDENCPPWGATAEDGWCPVAARPHVSGAFIWTGFDYRGEPTPYAWPNVHSHFGVIDMGGLPKDLYFYYQSVWRARDTHPVARLVPHRWDWDAADAAACAPHCRRRWLSLGGLEVDVHVYTNGDEVELLLNGRSLGRKPAPVEPGGGVRCRRVEFPSVPYAPGTLEARAYRTGRGGVWAADVVQSTAGVPAALGLAVDWPVAPHAVLEADGADVALVDVRVVDAEGRVIETAASHRGVNFTLSFAPAASGDLIRDGSGARILGVGNGDPSCHEPDTFPDTPLAAWRSAFMGHVRVVLQSGRAVGTLTLTATSPGLKGASVAVAVRNDKVRDARALLWAAAAAAAYEEREIVAAGVGGAEGQEG